MPALGARDVELSARWRGRQAGSHGRQRRDAQRAHRKVTPREGKFNEYELIYVVADERDVIQFRTVYNGEHVYLYHTHSDARGCERAAGGCAQASEQSCRLHLSFMTR